ncbi:MAG: calcium/sodium antiporter [Acidimicrobiales bacterium]
MVVDLVVLSLGVAVLARGADAFVLGAARLAVSAGVSPLVIGAVVVGFGTGTPELLVSASAAADGSLDLATGNVIGSNLANLTLVLGAAGLLVQPPVTSRILRREAPLSLVAVLLVAVAMQEGFTRPEGAALLVALTAAVVVMLRVTAVPDAQLAAEEMLEAEVEEFVEVGTEDELGEVARASKVPDVARTVLGLAGTLLGAQLVVTAATSLADRLDLSGGFVGVTLVAIGTSLPELVTAVQSARRHETELLVGNVLGSNMFNSLGVAGVAALVGPARIDDTGLTTVGMALMVGVAALSWVFLGLGGRLRRWEATVLLAAYVGTLPFLA